METRRGFKCRKPSSKCRVSDRGTGRPPNGDTAHDLIRTKSESERTINRRGFSSSINRMDYGFRISDVENGAKKEDRSEGKKKKSRSDQTLSVEAVHVQPTPAALILA